MSRLDALASPNAAIYVDRMRDGRRSENTKFLQSDATREDGAVMELDGENRRTGYRGLKKTKNKLKRCHDWISKSHSNN